MQRRLVERRHIAATRRRTVVSSRLFCTFDPVTLTFDLFDLILIGWRDIVMDYSWAKFGDFSFRRFDFIVRTNRQTDIIAEADQRYTHATRRQ